MLLQVFNLAPGNVTSGTVSANTQSAWQTLVPNGQPAQAGMIVEVSLTERTPCSSCTPVLSLQLTTSPRSSCVWGRVVQSCLATKPEHSCLSADTARPSSRLPLPAMRPADTVYAFSSLTCPCQGTHLPGTQQLVHCGAESALLPDIPSAARRSQRAQARRQPSP